MSKLLQKVEKFADNYSHFEKSGELTSNNEPLWEFRFGSMIGELGYSESGWCDVTTSGLKKAFLGISCVTNTVGQTLYNVTIFRLNLIFGFIKKV